MNEIVINGRRIGPGQPAYVIAEVSANHNGKLERALAIVRAAKAAGADAVKLQTYTADTITLKSDSPLFRHGGGGLWAHRDLYSLYQEAYTPWEWHAPLKALADELKLTLFSTPFDPTAVDFLEKLGVPAYKIASFELVDIPLIQKVARTGQPLILSTGMGTLEEIAEAVAAFRSAGGTQLALLKCTSAYPSPPEAMNLRTLRDLHTRFAVPAGLSDHSMGHTVAVAAVALGACVIEKHFTLDRGDPGLDSAFSMEPAEFKAMIAAIRTTEAALGNVSYEATPAEAESRRFRRSLFVTRAMKAGELFSADNVRSVRPGAGLPPKHQSEVLGKRATRDIPAGTPLEWGMVEK
ncbi:MAG: pseudaminic acid synthase [Opitutaceae bacterium]|nr:pseudaminic acid synthase [Opitutaceae bacterium]